MSELLLRMHVGPGTWGPCQSPTRMLLRTASSKLSAVSFPGKPSRVPARRLAGAAVSAVMLLRDWVTPGRTPKLLQIGTTLLFAGLALYSRMGGPQWSIVGVRLRVDTGLLAIVLASMALGRPFTLQYAREQVAPALWNSAVFMRTNYVITGA
jgi:hypothetical protein